MNTYNICICISVCECVHLRGCDGLFQCNVRLGGVGPGNCKILETISKILETSHTKQWDFLFCALIFNDYAGRDTNPKDTHMQSVLQPLQFFPKQPLQPPEYASAMGVSMVFI